MQGVLTLVIELWSFGSPGGLPSPHFGSVNFIFTLFQSRVATLLFRYFHFKLTFESIKEFGSVLIKIKCLDQISKKIMDKYEVRNKVPNEEHHNFK
jgi:hypothetical protein